jgi:hypothetical protein
MTKTKTHWVFPKITVKEIHKLTQKFPRHYLLIDNHLGRIMAENGLFESHKPIFAVKHEKIARAYRKITRKKESLYKIVEKPFNGNSISISEIQGFEKQKKN